MFYWNFDHSSGKKAILIDNNARFSALYFPLIVHRFVRRKFSDLGLGDLLWEVKFYT